MAQLDRRYALIKPMLNEGKIQSFADIFTWIPKTVVAKDMGKKVDRFTALLNRVEDFTIKDLLVIGSRCNLTRSEMLRLIDTEIARRNNENTMPDTP